MVRREISGSLRHLSIRAIALSLGLPALLSCAREGEVAISGMSSGTGAGAATGAGGDIGGCLDAIDAISARVTGVHACTSVVRLDYVTKNVVGFQILCAPYAATDEAMARAQAQEDTGFGEWGASLASPPPPDELVFWQAPADFGGVAAVARRNGISVFGGSISWRGPGEITYPRIWQPADQLGLGCPPPDGKEPPPARGFDLRSGTALAAAEVSAALAVPWRSALPGGLWKNGYVFDAMVLLYPRTVGAFRAATAEWIVLINSGWLE